MPVNPYDEEALKRQQQVGMLGQPTSNTMPIGGRPSVIAAPPPPGWDAGNWADPNMDSVKYDAGRLLYGKTRPSQVGETVKSAAFQQRFPGATFNGKDWIDFAGALSDGDSGVPVHGIDYLKGANAETDTSEGAWWGAPEAGGGAPTTARAPSTIDPRMDNSALMKIMAELNAASNGEDSPAEREAMLAMLQGL
jgi:hypothetical protein